MVYLRGASWGTFFILFMNDLLLHVESELDMYADDSTLCATGKTVEDLDLKLNNDMDCVNEWCNNNHMVGNGYKTKAMLITNYQKESKLPKKNLTIFFNNTHLKNVNSEKLLGVKIYKHLTWKDHVNKTAKTISRNLSLFRRIKKYLPHQTRITFYKAYIQTISNPILTIVIQYEDNRHTFPEFIFSKRWHLE